MTEQLRSRGLHLFRGARAFTALCSRVAAFVLFACALNSACERQTRITEAAFELHTSMGCELGATEELALVALGDFPSRRASFDVRDSQASFDQFPVGTRELSIEGRFADVGAATGRANVVAAAGGVPRSVVMLPEGRSCPLSDRGITAGDGAAVAALPGGGLLSAGGTSVDGKILSSAVAVAPGEILANPVPDGMLFRRRFGTATAASGWIVIAGGSEGAGETYEVFDTVRGVFARELSRKLANSRMEHGAALLPDGSVLLVGGRSEPDGPPLATAEVIRLEPPVPDQPNDLVEARVAPTVLVLDSGAVIVAAGRDGDGNVVPSLERFEVASRQFLPLDLDLPSYENVVAVALPGARIAWLGCDTRSHVCGLTLVLLHGDEPVRVDTELDWQSSTPLGLSTLRAVALDDGRLLVTGRDPDALMLSRAFVIDLDRRTIESVEATRAPTVLIPLEDGTIAELDPFGTSLRRAASFSIYDSPKGNLLAADSQRVAIDAPDRWERSEDGWKALVPGARIDIPHMEFGNFSVELHLDGDALVQIATSDAPELAVKVGSRISAPGCPKLTASGNVVWERRAGAVVVKRSDSDDQACVIPLPSTSRAKLAIEAEIDAVLRELRVTRL
jgi:hypothetical protein